MNLSNPFLIVLLVCSMLFIWVGTGCNHSTACCDGADSTKTASVMLSGEDKQIANRIRMFDELNFVIINNQEWERLKESHSSDVQVVWPNGRVSYGLESHIEELKTMFVFAPNASINEHKFKFGSGDLTCFTGIIAGTFSKPMLMEDGSYTAPTGQSFSIPFCVVAVWKENLIIEKYMYWDNQAFKRQIAKDK